ncbi:MAG TPA: Clp protease N-terminal domain-containing protein, partial [Clostridiales bacterium]|nr:Clp protease N-terminal domain-containing protein [Clostridiales bacterium]
MFGRFTEKAEKALSLAQESAARLGHSYVGTEHLLLGLLKEGTGVAARVLQSQGVTEEKIISQIDELIGRG